MAYRAQGEKLGEAAEQLIRQALDDERFDRMIESMVRSDFGPELLGRARFEGPESVTIGMSQVRGWLEGIGAEELALVERITRAAHAGSDPARALFRIGTQSAYWAIPESVLGLPDERSVVLEAIPELRDKVDRYGLVDLPVFEALPDALLYKPHVLSYHQLLRRDFSFHVNDALTTELVTVAGAGARVSVAFDERRIRPRSSYQMSIEKDYWFGPPLDEARLDDRRRRDPETLVHRWPADKEWGPLDGPYEQATIYTKLDGSVRTIEIEELFDPRLAAQPCDLRLVRYLHAERDIEAQAFRHMDGAVRYYRPEAYEARRTMEWPRGDGQPDGRRKVFRINGSIDTDTWSNIAALWFRGNELVCEALAALAPAKGDEG